MPKTSIIIPVYNAEKTLPYCLDSILKQTYQDYEIILINDGSKDRSQEIIEKYKKDYPDKIVSYTQKNSGIAKTRNRGIQLSKGKYLFFIDNDDYIEKDYIEKFIKSIEKSNADVVIGGYKRFDLERNRVIFQREATDTTWAKYMMLAPWARVYRKESLIKNNLEFLDSNIGEDIYLNVLANLKLDVRTLNYNGYYWVYNTTSVSNTKQKGLKKTTNFLPLLSKIYNDSKSFKITEEDRKELEYFFLKTCIHYLLYSGKGVNYKRLKETKDEAFNWLKESYPSYRNNPLISPFSPKGEAFSTRTIVWIYVLLQKLHLENAFLWVYSKL